MNDPVRIACTLSRAGHVSRLVDGRAGTGRAAKCAEVMHHAPCPQKGMTTCVAREHGSTCELPPGVYVNALAAAAPKCAKVEHACPVPQKSVSAGVALGVGVAGHPS